MPFPDREDCGKGCWIFCKSEFLGGSPCVPVSKARAAATEAIAEFSKFLISSLSDKEELEPMLPINAEAVEMGVVFCSTDGMLCTTLGVVVTITEAAAVACLC